MSDEEFAQFLDRLQAAKDELWEAFHLMDGIEGLAPGGEDAWVAANHSIDSLREIEVAYRKTLA